MVLRLPYSWHQTKIYQDLQVQSLKLKKYMWMIAYLFPKYPKNFAFQLFEILQ